MIVDCYEPEAYANKIIQIRENDDLEALSVEMRDRVKNAFSYDVVNNRIYAELKKI